MDGPSKITHLLTTGTLFYKCPDVLTHERSLLLLLVKLLQCALYPMVAYVRVMRSTDENVLLLRDIKIAKGRHKLGRKLIVARMVLYQSRKCIRHNIVFSCDVFDRKAILLYCQFPSIHPGIDSIVQECQILIIGLQDEVAMMEKILKFV